MTTGELIRAARKDADMTQAELAQKLGISYVGISQWENGLRQPKYETLKRIADALDVDWYTLVPPEEGSRIVLEHTNDVISQNGNQGKSFVKTWPPEEPFPSDQDKHMAGLMELYYHGVVRWAEDKLFSEAETIAIKRHFSELLFRYKQIIEQAFYAKYSASKLVKAGVSQAVIQQHLTDELEKKLDDLKAWINTIPHYLTLAVSCIPEQSDDSILPEEE